MLPPTPTFTPAPSMTAPIHAVVVVLPLVPVTAMIGASRNRNASSSSEISGRPLTPGSCSTGAVGGIPGLKTSRSHLANFPTS